jgi:ABC-type sugar transport system substrate-binding protein
MLRLIYLAALAARAPCQLFQASEKFLRDFPRLGKSPRSLSNQWKTGQLEFGKQEAEKENTVPDFLFSRFTYCLAASQN